MPKQDGGRFYPSDPQFTALPATGYGQPIVQTRRIDLSTVFTDMRIDIQGSFFWISRASDQLAMVGIKFNDQSGQGIYAYKGISISGLRFNRLYLTNQVIQIAQWIEISVSEIPLSIENSQEGPGLVTAISSWAITSANSATPVSFAWGGWAAGIGANYSQASSPFETWVGCKPTSPADLYFSPGDPAHQVVDTNCIYLAIGERLVLPYLPFYVQCVSAHAVNAATLSFMSVMRFNPREIF